MKPFVGEGLLQPQALLHFCQGFPGWRGGLLYGCF